MMGALRLAPLAAAGLVVLMTVAPASPARAADPPPLQEGVAAIYRGEPILIEEITREIAALGLADSAEARRAGLNSVLIRRMIAARARATRLDETPDGLALVRRTTELTLAQLFERTLPGPASEPTDAEVEAYMAARPLQFAQRRVYVVRQLAAAPANRDLTRFETIRDLATLRSLLDGEGVDYEETVAALDTSTADSRFMTQLANLGRDIYMTPTKAALVFGEVLTVHEVPFDGELARTFARQLLKLQRLKTAREQSLSALFRSEVASVTFADAFKPPAPTVP